MKGVPYLNLDPYCWFIGPKNWGEALIDEELMTCLLDNGSQLNFSPLPMSVSGEWISCLWTASPRKWEEKFLQYGA